MREWAFNMIPTPPVGLRPRQRSIRRDTSFLSEAFNIRGDRYGLEEYIDVADPFGGAISTIFPNPQIIRMSGKTLLLGSTSLREINESGAPWTASVIDTYNPDDPNALKAITAGGEWHAIDFKDAYYLFNGSCVVYRTGLGKLEGVPERTFVQDGVTVHTGCAFRGRAIVGGFDPADVWDDFWQGVFLRWQAQGVEHQINTSHDDIGKNWVMWSSIGGADFPLWLFYPPCYYGRESAPSGERLLERLKRNELGWMPMPFQGQIHHIKPLRDAVIVYGEDGVAALQPVSVGVGTEFPPTFGVREVLPIGVAGRGYVGGDHDRHIFIDQQGSLWAIGSELVAERLGYEEFLFSTLGVDTRITYDPYERDFRISTPTEGFLFNDTGLFQHRQSVASAVRVAGGLVGTFENRVTAADTEARYVSNPIDMQSAGLKHITFVSVDVRGTEYDLFVAIDYRYNRHDAWQRSDWVQLNYEGNARVNISGLEFRIAIKCVSFAGFEIDQVKVRWQRDDIRVIRGPDADPSVTGASVQ